MARENPKEQAQRVEEQPELVERLVTVEELEPREAPWWIESANPYLVFRGGW